jgi:hypothetical protein
VRYVRYTKTVLLNGSIFGFLYPSKTIQAGLPVIISLLSASALALFLFGTIFINPPRLLLAPVLLVLGSMSLFQVTLIQPALLSIFSGLVVAIHWFRL